MRRYRHICNEYGILGLQNELRNLKIMGKDSFTTFIIAPVQICSDLDSLAAVVVAQRAGRS